MFISKRHLLLGLTILLATVLVTGGDAQDGTLATHNDLVNTMSGEGWGQISAANVYEEMIQTAGFVVGTDLFILDVRNPSEWEDTGVIEGSLLISMNELFTEAKLAELSAYITDSEAEFIVACGSGIRSTIAMTLLRMNGFPQAKSLSKGIAAGGGWIDSGYPVVAYP